MSYASKGTLGFQKWGVTNPWVWANLAQPQRQRGNVSPMVFQTAGPYLKSAHLGAAPSEGDLQKWWNEEGKHLSFDQLTRQYGPGDPEFEFWMGGAGITPDPNAELRRASRMERIAIAGMAMSAASLWLGYRFYRDREVSKNRKKRRSRRRRRTSR